MRRKSMRTLITFEYARTIFVGSGAGMCEGECICEDVYMNSDLHVYMHVHVVLRMCCTHIVNHAHAGDQ